ncbi:MAG: galactokinase [Anaerolineales bacterium]
MHLCAERSNRIALGDSNRRGRITQQFIQMYSESPQLWVQAPGRVDLMGSHTDYNEGFVLTQSIDRNTWIAVSPREDNKIRISSMNASGSAEVDLADIRHNPTASWADYVSGVAAVFKQEGYQLKGFNGLIHSTIPFSSGLSSSAALEVASAVLFVHLGDLQIVPVDIAKLCQRAEREFVGVNCGILDQYSSTMGKVGQVLLLDCRCIYSETSPIADEVQVVICDTCKPRMLTGSEYQERQIQCEQGTAILSRFYPDIHSLRDVNLEQLDAHKDDLPAIVASRCRFIIQENQRVLDMANALAKPDFDQIKLLTSESFAGARDLYQISCSEMDEMYAAMTSSGAIGARQAGAGFGGCMLALVHPEHLDAFINSVHDLYLTKTDIKPEVFPVTTSPGAGMMSQ